MAKVVVGYAEHSCMSDARDVAKLRDRTHINTVVVNKMHMGDAFADYALYVVHAETCIAVTNRD